MLSSGILVKRKSSILSSPLAWLFDTFASSSTTSSSSTQQSEETTDEKQYTEKEAGKEVPSIMDEDLMWGEEKEIESGEYWISPTLAKFLADQQESREGTQQPQTFVDVDETQEDEEIAHLLPNTGTKNGVEMNERDHSSRPARGLQAHQVYELNEGEVDEEDSDDDDDTIEKEMEKEQEEELSDEEIDVGVIDKMIEQAVAQSADPFSVPIDAGWRREVVTRQTGATVGRKDVYYYSPVGKKFRSTKEIERFLLKEGITELSVANFSFNGSVMVEDSSARLARVRRQVTDEVIASRKSKKERKKHHKRKRRCIEKEQGDYNQRGGRKKRKTFYFCDDISYGTEKSPIQCVNQVDEEMPEKFSYVAVSIPGRGVEINQDTDFLVCCDCEDGCVDPEKCACIQLTSRGEHPVYKQKRLVKPVPVIYECNHRCACMKDKDKCANRVVQNGVVAKLQVFKTEEKGWGVRCLHSLPAHTFVCCYTGEILTNEDAEYQGQSHGDEYLIDLDFLEVWNTVNKPGYEENVVLPEDQQKEEEEKEKEIEGEKDREKEKESDWEKEKEYEESPNTTPLVTLRWEDCTFPPGYEHFYGAQDLLEKYSREQREIYLRERKEQRQREQQEKEKEKENNSKIIHLPFNTRKYYGEEEPYVTNAKLFGGVGRFLNHSCDPNLLKQQVFLEHHDVRFPQMCFFTARRIPANTELTWNYNYVLDSVPGKTLLCNCGAWNCRGRLY